MKTFSRGRSKLWFAVTSLSQIKEQLFLRTVHFVNEPFQATDDDDKCIKCTGTEKASRAHKISSYFIQPSVIPSSMGRKCLHKMFVCQAGKAMIALRHEMRMMWCERHRAVLSCVLLLLFLCRRAGISWQCYQYNMVFRLVMVMVCVIKFHAGHRPSVAKNCKAESCGENCENFVRLKHSIRC